MGALKIFNLFLLLIQRKSIHLTPNYYDVLLFFFQGQSSSLSKTKLIMEDDTDKPQGKRVMHGCDLWTKN